MKRNFKVYKTLLPLSWIYGLGVCFRNKLFDWKILPTEEFDIPVISVGNLAVGGTGKTPHTEYLISLLSKKYKLAVLSRGYKRKSKGFILADESASAQKIGDEPYQIYRKFPTILVTVDIDRRRAIRSLLALPEAEKPEIILLDDAFQYRYVTPSLSILLTDSNRLFYHDYLLPAGRLREPAKNCSRADIIIYTKCVGQPTYCDNENTFFTSYSYENLLPVFTSSNPVKEKSIEQLKKESYSFLLIAGLANPTNLINYLENYTSDLHSLIYSDHHDFTNKNMDDIKKTFEKIKNENKLIITSEKDAVRLMDNSSFPEELKAFIFYLPIQVVFNLEQENLFIQTIEEHVKNFARNRILA